MAIYVTALMSGQMVAPALGGAIGSVAGWRSAIAFSAAIGPASRPSVVALVAGPRRPTPGGTHGSRPLDSATTAAGPPRRELFALALAPFATFFGMAGLTQTLIPLIGNGELDFSASATGWRSAPGRRCGSSAPGWRASRRTGFSRRAGWS